MKKYKVEIDEKWPVFTIHSVPDDYNHRSCIMLSDENAESFIDIQNKYTQLQMKLKGVYERSERRDKTYPT